jgi:hypothetical protein
MIWVPRFSRAFLALRLYKKLSLESNCAFRDSLQFPINQFPVQETEQHRVFPLFEGHQPLILKIVPGKLSLLREQLVEYDYFAIRPNPYFHF